MQTDLLAQLLDWVRSRHFGKFRGTVVDNQDATERGRLKVRVPAVLGDLELWAMPCVPYAGDGVGFFALPEAGTGVWVEFEAGDASFPIWTGFFWADNELPDGSDAKVKTWRTQSASIRIDDEQKEVRVEADEGGRVTVADRVELTREGASHTVDSAGVTSAIDGQKTALTSSAFSVNDGALRVQ